jgi:hypothetical protein
MLSFSQPPQEFAVGFVAFTVTACPSALLQQRIKIIENQQTSRFTKILDETGYLLVGGCN